MRVLIFAYACNPDEGSEPGAGAAIVKAVSRAFPGAALTVLTRTLGSRTAAELASELGANVEVIEVRTRPIRSTYGRYLFWLIAATRRARIMRSQTRYDVIHQATYASDWFVTPFHLMRKLPHERWVWGPAGGASYATSAVTRLVTQTSAVREVVRTVATRPFRAVTQRTAAKSVDAVIAMNEGSARGFRSAGFRRVEVFANTVIDYSLLPERAASTRGRLVYAGRGVNWKGLPFLISLLGGRPDLHLVIAGPETDTPYYRKLAQRSGASVEFVGALTRSETMELLAGAQALIFLSLHDSAGWTAAEAAGIGTPVVCLDLGGVSAMAGDAGIVVASAPAKTLAERVLVAIESSARHSPSPSRAWSLERLSARLAPVYSDGGRQ